MLGVGKDEGSDEGASTYNYMAKASAPDLELSDQFRPYKFGMGIADFEIPWFLLGSSAGNSALPERLHSKNYVSTLIYITLVSRNTRCLQLVLYSSRLESDRSRASPGRAGSESASSRLGLSRDSPVPKRKTV